MPDPNAGLPPRYLRTPEAARFEDTPHAPVLGRLVERGLHDELNGEAYAVIDAAHDNELLEVSEAQFIIDCVLASLAFIERIEASRQIPAADPHGGGEPAFRSRQKLSVSLSSGLAKTSFARASWTTGRAAVLSPG